VVVATKTLGNVTHLRCLACLQPGDVAVDDAPQRRLVDVLEPGLEPPDVLLDLLEEGEIVGQFRQSRIRRDLRWIDPGTTSRDQYRVERIVLGAAQMYLAERLDLQR